MASRSSTVIISSSPIAKVGGLLTLTIAASNGTRLPFSFASVPLAPKYDSHPFGGWPPNLVSTMGDTGSLLFYTKHLGLPLPPWPHYEPRQEACRSRSSSSCAESAIPGLAPAHRVRASPARRAHCRPYSGNCLHNRSRKLWSRRSPPRCLPVAGTRRRPVQRPRSQ